MTSIVDHTPTYETPISEFVAVLNALGEAARPWVHAYMALCRSPEIQEATRVVNALNRELSRSALVQVLVQLQRSDLSLLLAPSGQAEAAIEAVDPDLWYQQCVQFAWLDSR